MAIRKIYKVKRTRRSLFVSTNDYLKFVTEEVVKYIDTPKDKRKEQRKRRKNERAPFLSRWFGIIPFAIAMSMKKRNKRK